MKKLIALGVIAASLPLSGLAQQSSTSATSLPLAFTTTLNENRDGAGGILGHIKNGISWYKGRANGHEEITRQAMNDLKDRLLANGINAESDRHGLRDFLQNREYTAGGMNTPETTNYIIKGNYIADHPHGLEKDFDIKEYVGIKPEDDYDTSPIMQEWHGLRRVVNANTSNPHEILMDQKNTCQNVREKMIKSTRDGIGLLSHSFKLKAEAQSEKNAARREELSKASETAKRYGMVLIGLTTHTLQDTFSPAHTIRDFKENNHNVRNICYYDSKIMKKFEAANALDTACFHKDVDLKDSVWVRNIPDFNRTRSEWADGVENCGQGGVFSLLKPLPQGEKRESCMKHEARLAKIATERYLFIVATYMNNLRVHNLKDPEFKLLEKLMTENLFDGNMKIPGIDHIMAQGVYRCDNLRASPPTTGWAATFETAMTPKRRLAPMQIGPAEALPGFEPGTPNLVKIAK